MIIQFYLIFKFQKISYKMKYQVPKYRKIKKFFINIFIVAHNNRH